eukprot:gene3550-2588_t
MNTKAAVKQALKTPLVQNEVWQPIATAWFDKWKAYVNFNDVADVKKVEGLHPGPVDNGPLKGSIGDELRRDLVAERDYVLIPQATATMLVDVFGGGPKFPRTIRVVDDAIDRYVEVELWPLRVHLYLCDSGHPTPEPQGPQFRRRYYRWTNKLQEAVNDAKKHLFSAYVTTPIRCWLRETPPKTEALDTNMGRRLTNDMVEWTGDWHVIRSDVMGRRIKDIRGGDPDCVELIIEVAPCRHPKLSDWPRFHLLEAWKRDIRMGDMIDARDAQGLFRTAAVIQVSEVGDVAVRYWTGGNDEWILTKDFEYRIAPLHSHSSATSVPTVDMAAPCTLGKRPREMPPMTTSVRGGGEENHESARVAEVNRGVCGELSRSGSGIGSGSTTTTPPLTRWWFTIELVTELVTKRSK